MSWPDLISNILPVGSALGGILLATWLSNRAANRARTDARRDAAAEALAELTENLDRHRALMWKMVGRRLATAMGLIPDDPAAANADQDAVHASRAAITRPVTMLCLRAPALAPAARAAERAAYDIRRAKRVTDLERRRAAARQASEDLVTAAGRLLGNTDSLPPRRSRLERPAHKGTGDLFWRDK